MTPTVKEYMDLLAVYDYLMANHRDGTEAEAVLEKMRVPWFRATAAERQQIRDLSAVMDPAFDGICHGDSDGQWKGTGKVPGVPDLQ